MINLIPPHARKQVKAEYWTRVVSVWVFLSALALFVTACLFLPSYVLIQSQLDAYAERYVDATEGNATYQDLEATVSRANADAKQLLTGADMLNMTTILREIELITNETITTETIDIRRTEEGIIDTFTIEGVADSRVSLAAYRDAIEAHELFVSAALPISNLAKDVDVPFRITVTVYRSDT